MSLAASRRRRLPLGRAVAPAAFLFAAAFAADALAQNSPSGFGSSVVARTPRPTPTAVATAPPLPEETGTPAVSLTRRDLDELAPLGPREKPAPAEKAEIEVSLNGQKRPLDRTAIVADPSEELTFTLRRFIAKLPSLTPPASAQLDPNRPKEFEIQETNRAVWKATRGTFVSATPEKALWRAPATPGVCTVSFVVRRDQRAEDLSPGNVDSSAARAAVEGRWEGKVLVRAVYDPEGEGLVQGWPIGIYPNPTVATAPASVRERAAAYAPPRWMVPVTPETAGLSLSRSFTLGDFSSPADLKKPHYIALDPRLPLVLQWVADRLESGKRPQQVQILRGFVSPYARPRLAREGIGIEEYSRYQYGDAALIIAGPGDGTGMADLNGDGSVDESDGQKLADLVAAAQKELEVAGGIGIEMFKMPNGVETVAVHVDLRGWAQRWYPQGGAAKSPAAKPKEKPATPAAAAEKTSTVPAAPAASSGSATKKSGS